MDKENLKKKWFLFPLLAIFVYLLIRELSKMSHRMF